MRVNQIYISRFSRSLLNFGSISILILTNSACQAKPVTPEPSIELVFRTWEDDLPDDLFSNFTQNTGIRVLLEPYESQEEAVADLKAGKNADILVMDSRFIPDLIRKNNLEVIDRSNVPNFRYISAGFRGLSFDPNNQYSIPFQWGTTGIVYRSDLTGREITKWSDLWDQSFKGKVSLWKGQSREVVGLTLIMLGYSANSENPNELKAAMKKLDEIKSDLVWVELIDPYSAVPGLLDGRIFISMGYAYDEVEGRKENPSIKYVLPKEGAVLWGEHFVIPSTAEHPAEAEKLLNYLLEPDVMASIVEFNYFAAAHDGAFPLLPSDIRNDPLIYPPDDLLQNAEIILAISPEAESRLVAAWGQFIASAP